MRINEKRIMYETLSENIIQIYDKFVSLCNDVNYPPKETTKSAKMKAKKPLKSFYEKLKTDDVIPMTGTLCGSIVASWKNMNEDCQAQLYVSINKGLTNALMKFKSPPQLNMEFYSPTASVVINKIPTQKELVNYIMDEINKRIILSGPIQYSNPFIFNEDDTQMQIRD